jgi:hypothetical protein
MHFHLCGNNIFYKIIERLAEMSKLYHHHVKYEMLHSGAWCGIGVVQSISSMFDQPQYYWRGTTWKCAMASHRARGRG